MKHKILAITRATNAPDAKVPQDIADAHHANSFFSHLKGLVGSSGLNPGTGLLISPCNQVHTIGMRFNLDLVFIDAQGTVLKCVHNLPPFRVVGAWRSKHVLELPANTLKALQLQPGRASAMALIQSKEKEMSKQNNKQQKQGQPICTTATIHRLLNATRMLLMLTVASATLAACSMAPSLPSLSKADPFDTVAQADKAYERGDWLVAERYYVDLTRMVPTDAYAWHRLGNIRLRQNNFAGAASAFQESIERDSESARAQYNLATAHLLMARDALQAADSLLPPNDGASELIAEKLAHFDDLVYEPMIDVASPNDGLITKKHN